MDSLYAMLVSVFATGAMLAALQLAKKADLISKTMITTLGTLITGEDRRSLLIGTIAYFVCGLFFGLMYWSFWNGLEEGGLIINLPLGFVFGTIAGFVHGVIATLSLALMCKSHPLYTHQKMTPEEAAANVGGHIIFGIVLGLFRGFLS